MGYPDASTYHGFLIRQIRDARGCAICGGNHRLSFHHLPDTTKYFRIGDVARAPHRIIDEIEKCAVLCTPCHATLHKLNPHFPRPVLQPIVLTAKERASFLVRKPAERIAVMEASR